MLLRQLIDAAGLSADQVAGTVGVSKDTFVSWASGARPIPIAYSRLLAAVLGVKEQELEFGSSGKSQSPGDLLPAMWFKFRGDRLVDADREVALLIRQLGHYIDSLEEVTQRKTTGWRSFSEGIARAVDPQAPPREQGKVAAQIFRTQRGFGPAAALLGDVLRGNLRSLGMLVIEQPVPKSQLEGCSFFVGAQPNDRPCIFANTHRVTWFRRNKTILHEVAHAIFEGESAGAVFDFAESGVVGSLVEERADAFARSMLAPRGVLRHAAERHKVRWDSLQAEDLAQLVAEIQIEPREILGSALEDGLITSEQSDNYLRLDIAEALRAATDHALSTSEFIAKYPEKAAAWQGKRETSLPSRTLRLPSAYVSAVVGAVGEGEISPSKAAEYLMITEPEFFERFPNVNGATLAEL